MLKILASLSENMANQNWPDRYIKGNDSYSVEKVVGSAFELTLKGHYRLYKYLLIGMDWKYCFCNAIDRE